MVFTNIFSHSLGDGFFCCAKVSKFAVVPHVDFCFMFVLFCFELLLAMSVPQV